VRWNCELKEYSNTYDANDKPVISSDAFMMKDLGKDPYAIAYSGIAEQTPEVKSLALAEKKGGPYVAFTRETVAVRTYPLTRSMYLYVNKAPGKPLDAKVDEFVRFILSRQGQEAVAQQKVFIPLTAAAVAEQRRKLE
jgi:phosphate transport system substrate-binding protein